MNLLEAGQALKKGKKISHPDWGQDSYFYIKNGKIIDETGGPVTVWLNEVEDFEDEKYFVYDDDIKYGLYTSDNGDLILYNGETYEWSFKDSAWSETEVENSMYTLIHRQYFSNPYDISPMFVNTDDDIIELNWGGKLDSEED